VLTEKYDFSAQDASDMSDFLVPLLDFVPEKRPTAAQCLTHPWMSAGPRTLEPSLNNMQADAINGEKPRQLREKDEQEAVEVSMGNMAIDGTPKTLKDFQSTKPSE